MIGWLMVAGLVFAGPPQIVSRFRFRRRTKAEVDPLMTARLLAIAVASGLPLGAAILSVRPYLDGTSLGMIDDLLARARTAGLTRALAETTGPFEQLAQRLAGAQVSGAPIAPTLTSFVSTHSAAVRAAATEEARTLGVRLIVPISLLLLPGFVALVIGPYLLEQLAGFLGPGFP